MTQMDNSALISAFSENSDDVWLVFLTITHASMTGGPLRLVRNTKAVDRVIDTVTHSYEGVLFDITLPADMEKELTGASITVPNVDRSITDKLRKLIGQAPAVVTIEVSVSTAPDDIQFGPFDMDLSNITWSAANVQGTLSPALFFNQLWPKYRFDNAQFPGLFPG